jgi:hypothetical protein
MWLYTISGGASLLQVGGGGGASGEGARHFFWNLESLKYDFLHFQGKIIQNSEDYKVKNTRFFHDYTYIWPKNVVLHHSQ